MAVEKATLSIPRKIMKTFRYISSFILSLAAKSPDYKKKQQQRNTLRYSCRLCRDSDQGRLSTLGLLRRLTAYRSRDYT